MEATADSGVVVIDEAYEFSAPRFFDFINDETEEDRINAELWFDSALSHAPSPFTSRIKTGRSVQVESICDFTDAIEQPPSEITSTEPKTATVTTEDKLADPVVIVINDPTRSESVPSENNKLQVNEEDKDVGCIQLENKRKSSNSSSPIKAVLSVVQDQANCTPKLSILNSATERTDLKKKKQQTAQKIASIIRNPSVLRSQTRSQLLSHNKCPKPATAKREPSLKNTVATPSFAQENQAGKRQKLEGGKSRQILNIINPTNLLHKSKHGTVDNLSSLCSSTTDKPSKEDRKIYVRDPPPPSSAPFVSTAEMMMKFQSGTRDNNGNAASSVQRKANHLRLTRPKEPELVSSQRVRPAIKSSAEIEEEMMAKIPKFKARPLRKKILEAPTLPPLPRSTPNLTEFNEFHLETMARAVQHEEPSNKATNTKSSAPSQQIDQWKPRFTAPKSPVLQTSLRSRPPSIKSSDELEKEELENAPKFKARPLNRKIFESKGDLGIFCNTKKQVTIPQEFHFKIDERIPPPTTFADMFEKMSLCSESSACSRQIPRNTRPNPFHLLTEERGAEKEKRFVTELTVKEILEEKARVHKALPYPYTTDYPLIPPKPEAKQCTKPEPFQLESVVRHEEEMQREMEERKRMEKEEAEMKIFKALPIMTEDPIPVPEKVRVPLTEVQGFNLQVQHRAVERAEFDNKIKEKEQIYKRYRDEAESAKLMEEEKALKQLRRTMVPHARPVPNFSHPFMPQKSCKERTTPKSPKLQIDRRRQEKTRRITSSGAAAASNIR
ncbi:protein TPX2 [Impatiens glandulifera]|uniref:protein TPX2 n=1 Tax=Impatiens glandulifera TaxID=253017 RepID=UPI001FB0CEC8|nr:protein TPX2 [Impatiens glandulifera]